MKRTKRRSRNPLTSKPESQTHLHKPIAEWTKPATGKSG